MPAGSGREFMERADALLRDLDQSAALSAKELGEVRRELAEENRGDMAAALEKMRVMRIGRAEVLAPTSDTLRQAGLASERVRQRMSRFRLKWLSREQLREAVTRNPNYTPAEVQSFFRHSRRLARHAREFLQELGELEPTLEEEIGEALKQIEDAGNDLLKLEVKSWTQADETLRRLAQGRVSKAQARAAVRVYDVNRNLFNLSLLEHPKAVVRGLLANAAERMAKRTRTAVETTPKKAFMLVGTSPETQTEVRPAGRTASVLWKALTTDGLRTMAADQAKARQSVSSFRDLGLGYNTPEWYVPVPPENLDEVRELAEERRKAFLAEGRKRKKEQ